MVGAKTTIPAADHSARRVLWIEDDPQLRQLLTRILTPRGIDVETVELGLPGLERACSESWNLIGLDLQLPDLDGVEVLDRMRARGTTAPVLVFTALWDDSERINRAYRAGATECWPKRLRNRELIHLVDRLLRETSETLADARAEPVAALLGWIASIARPAGNSGTDAPDPPVSILHNLLLLAMVGPGVTIPCFAACAAVYRRISEGTMSWASLDDSAKAIRAALNISTAWPRQIAHAAAVLEGLKEPAPRNLEAVLARNAGVSPSHFGRLMKEHTRLKLQDWARLGRLRAAVRELSVGNERVKQIAVITHWSSHSQLDDSLRQTLGLSPRLLRRRLSEAEQWLKTRASLPKHSQLQQ